MLTIEIKEDPDDPKERARRAAAKRKQKEAEANASQKTKIPVGFYKFFMQIFAVFSLDQQFH